MVYRSYAHRTAVFFFALPWPRLTIHIYANADLFSPVPVPLRSKPITAVPLRISAFLISAKACQYATGLCNAFALPCSSQQTCATAHDFTAAVHYASPAQIDFMQFRRHAAPSMRAHAQPLLSPAYLIHGRSQP